MEVVDLNGHEIKFFVSSEVLPIKRFQRFNKYLMIDNDVGSTFEDYDKRTLKLVEFLRKDMKDEAIKELMNRRQMVFNAFEEYSPRNLALAIMVYSIDGQVVEDYSEENLERILKKLDEWGYSQAKLEENLTEVKKK